MRVDKDALEIWGNKKTPVVIRRGGSAPIRLRIPYSNDNRAWLKVSSRKRDPQWDKKLGCWELPKSRFNELVHMILERFDGVYIIQPYREKEVCARACMEATGFECQCSCMGRNHGASNSGGWFEVSDAFAVRYGEKRLACRLLLADS